MYMNFMLILLIMILIMMYKFKDNFLMILVSMEFFIVTNLILIMYYELFSGNEWFFLFYMIFSVCESIIGLSIVVNLIYFLGDQSMLVLSLKW